LGLTLGGGAAANAPFLTNGAGGLASGLPTIHSADFCLLCNAPLANANEVREVQRRNASLASAVEPDRDLCVQFSKARTSGNGD